MARLNAPTEGTRMMLWVYPAITVFYGLLYHFQSVDRMQSGAFEQAKNIMPMDWWGLLFLFIGVTKLLGIIQGSPVAYLASMCLGAGLWAWWGFLFLASAFANHTASFTGCLLPFGWSIAHLAMLATLTRGHR